MHAGSEAHARFAPNGKATAKNSPVGLINVAESTEYLTEAYITSEQAIA